MASTGGHAQTVVHRAPFGGGRVLAWILVVAFALALYTVYEYWRTGSFGTTYFLAAFAVLATLVLASVFLTVRPATKDLAPPAIQRPRDPYVASQAPSRSVGQIARRTVAFDGGPVRVIRSDFDVHGMLAREYSFVTEDGDFPLERLEAALDQVRLEPSSTSVGDRAERPWLGTEM